MSFVISSSNAYRCALFIAHCCSVPPPVVFKDAPESLHRVVFALVRRLVGQLNGNGFLGAELDQAVQPSGPAAIILRSTIGIDDQGMRPLVKRNLAPNLFYPVNHEVCRHLSGVNQRWLDACSGRRMPNGVSVVSGSKS